MSKVRMISTGSHRYNGVWLRDGSPFEANDENDAGELSVMGFARRDATAHTYDTRAMTAAAPAALAASGAPRQKRAYNRRNVGSL